LAANVVALVATIQAGAVVLAADDAVAQGGRAVRLVEAGLAVFGTLAEVRVVNAGADRSDDIGLACEAVLVAFARPRHSNLAGLLDVVDANGGVRACVDGFDAGTVATREE